MYQALEQALIRIFGTPELMMNAVSWHRDINSGYRKTVSGIEASSRDERLWHDGLWQSRLRQGMTPEWHDVLTIRYGDDYSKRIMAWQRIQLRFSRDERLPEPIRSNPVLIRLWLMYELQHPQLRSRKGQFDITGKSERTVYRWKKICRRVCSEWITLAEDEAQALLEQAGSIRYE
ncbi:hypothetical protein [Endozoicomonas sp. SCSIO W0465]|uniref:hypothetical protein n=1 Tax=Endozoicomonas sp. SCSIO W0465 TaxID=2918516 RepID=UPI002074C021|nr:hypothetical protein [Endozoicomonas sp. SCSIO W0465]USE36397.1 hypothetical protein MJO57_30990 [Endozoicomonas sp. SCSIO W0465]